MPEPALTLAGLFLKVGELLLGRKDRHATLRRENRTRVVTFIADIAQTLNAAADDLSVRQLPYNRCSELSYCLLNLKTVVREVMADEAILRDAQVDRMVDILSSAVSAPGMALQHLEQMRRAILVDLNEGATHSSTIAESEEGLMAAEVRKMKEAAGIFQGLAATIKALPSDA